MSKPDVALQQYRQLGLQSQIEAANPHRLIQMLMEGLLTKLSASKYCMEENNIAGKGENISMAISIIGGLRSSLDKDNGGEIAENLNNLYDYMERRLLEANLRSDVTIINEVMSLLNEIKSAWVAVAPEANVNGQPV